MKTNYTILLLAVFLLSTGCAKQQFDKVQKAKTVGSPVFGESDSPGDYGTGENDDGNNNDSDYGTGENDDGNNNDNDNNTGEDDRKRVDWNTQEPDWENYQGEFDHNVRLICSDVRTSHTGYNLMSADSLELRVIDKDGNVVCTNSNTQAIRNQIVNNKTLPMPSCSLSDNKYLLTLVDPKANDGHKDILTFSTQTVFIVRQNANSPWAFIDRLYQDDPTDEVEVLYNSNKNNKADVNCDQRASPLVIKTVNEDQSGMDLTSQEDGINFDILGENSNPYAHAKKRISWITKESYMFLVKPNARGKVEGIDEMFGDNTKGPDGEFADDGYAALAKYDLNKDSVIDSKDAVYVELKLWSDKNFDGKSQRRELISLEDAGLEAIDLEYVNSFSETDKYGNQTKMKSVVKYSDGSYKLIFDLWFNYKDLNNRSRQNRSEREWPNAGIHLPSPPVAL